MSRIPRKALPLRPDDPGGALLRLRVLQSLPQRHQNYLFEEVRQLCRDYLRSRRIHSSEMAPEDLISEVMLKFLAATYLPGDDEEQVSDPSQWTVDENDPKRDGRVAWLEQEIQAMCSTQALTYRCEDIRRNRYGRALRSGGRRTVQSGNEDDFVAIASDPEQEVGLMQAESRDVWRGLLLLIEGEHDPHDDIIRLLSVLKRQPDVFDDASGMRWPVGVLIKLLDQDFPPPPQWDDDRVDNAKRRLKRWIERLMHANGFDVTDLEAFFARVARTEAKVSTRRKESPPRSVKLDS